MLLLNRRVNESVIIADGLIRIVIVDIRRGMVRIGIDAPEDIDVNREEVYEKNCQARTDGS